MEEQDRRLIERIERDLGLSLTEMEKIICILGFRYGKIEGINDCQKLIKEKF